jgi:hypothetical protein
MMERRLDFIIIGAAKTGTTALFEYMRTHPEVALPREKETGFFTLDELYNRGWKWYERTYLADLPPSRRYGEASPAYMWGTPYSGSPLHAPRNLPPAPVVPGALERVVPERIAATLPDVKLVCILRDPIERALSHYRMSRLWGWEKRDADTAMTELARPELVAASRRWMTGTTWYIALGEYGRILKPYFDLFARDRIEVVFSSNLRDGREEVVRQLFAFIGVDPDWTPSNLDVKFREGASVRRMPAVDLYRWRMALARAEPLKRAWRSIPQRERDQLDRFYNWGTFRLDMWNAKRGQDNLDLSPEVRSTLEQHYAADGRTLAELIGRRPPWLDRWQVETPRESAA